MLRHGLPTSLLILSLFVSGLDDPALAQEAAAVSQCQAIAQSLPSVTFARYSPDRSDASFRLAAAEDGVVRLTLLGHSTFHIETPGGISIATDYSGYHRPPRTPDVVTMNKAHSTHYTLTPGPEIKTVLHGWGEEGQPADHDVVVGDTYIRNVTTDIRSGYGAMEPDGNSIFIFEVAGLCIGHLGHLHHELDDSDYAEIGRLDVVMVPVDGGLTMGADSMGRVVNRLRSAIILPMHRPGPQVTRFLDMFGAGFDRRYSDSATITVSLRSLPSKPQIVVLQGM
ncbi:MBL fold metallo-hydrolase [Rhizobium sp. YIM 134829]|uniref:MBL fold metallo-hydrolase n=1 Tax=Rhizobium sp. YIM 134829 TaxID=3390453 RepID=UPI00397D20DC